MNKNFLKEWKDNIFGNTRTEEKGQINTLENNQNNNIPVNPITQFYYDKLSYEEKNANVIYNIIDSKDVVEYINHTVNDVDNTLDFRGIVKTVSELPDPESEFLYKGICYYVENEDNLYKIYNGEWVVISPATRNNHVVQYIFELPNPTLFDGRIYYVIDEMRHFKAENNVWVEVNLMEEI